MLINPGGMSPNHFEKHETKEVTMEFSSMEWITTSKEKCNESSNFNKASIWMFEKLLHLGLTS